MNKRSFLFLGLGAVVLAGAGYAFTASSKSDAAIEYRAMSVAEMQENGGLVVDIRTPPEWAETGVIDGAALLTFNDPKSFLAQIQPAIADGRDLILVCRSGNRSSRAAQMLEGMIPNKIISVDGGMSRIVSSGYRTVRPN